MFEEDHLLSENFYSFYTSKLNHFFMEILHKPYIHFETE